VVSKAKLYTTLDSLEEELEARIVPHLETAAEGNNHLVFCVTDFNPFPALKHQTDATTEELVVLGRQILLLKNKLGESSEGSIAERICWYCRKWADTKNNYRGAAQGLAQQFLEEIFEARKRT